MPMMMALLRVPVPVAALLVARAPPSDPFTWRNDTANLELTERWNRYWAATPLSDDVSGPSISDSPPVSLSWSLGTDMPKYAMKDGAGCWIGNDFVLAGGLFEPHGLNDAHPLPKSKQNPNLAFAYDTELDTWSALPPAPFKQTRGTGACTNDSLILVGGRTAPPEGLSVARLHKPAGGPWAWQSLPPLPREGYRWLGAAGVVGDWLVVSTGTNTSRFQSDGDEVSPGPRTQHSAAFGAPNNLPAVLPSYRLNITGWRWPSSTATGGGGSLSEEKNWEKIATFPGLGLDAPNSAVAGGSLYVLGGWKGSVGVRGPTPTIIRTGLSCPSHVLMCPPKMPKNACASAHLGPTVLCREWRRGPSYTALGCPCRSLSGRMAGS
eukprot:SAG22_NODE_3162_length_1889_cov_1.432402_1_plen_379_part_00